MAPSREGTPTRLPGSPNSKHPVSSESHKTCPPPLFYLLALLVRGATNRAIADARAVRASAALSGSTGARVARVARAGARVGVRRDGAVVQVEGALACVAS